MQKHFRFLLLCFLVYVQGNAQLARTKTRFGVVEGTTENGIAIYKGIPFASPPVGELRWKAPVDPKPWKGVRECKAFAASPIQSKPVPFMCWTEEFIAPPEPLSEDCLYLNVWSGAKTPNEKRPVFVWIYGGGFNSGSAACDIYDGKEYAKKGVVFVSINYRVGALGFLVHTALNQEGTGTSGNYGLLDQVQALKWIKENIAAFGGDPANVTIAGQSAGSMSVNCLVASPKAAGLFHKAIAQSGGMLGGRLLGTREEMEQAGEELRKKLGVSSIADMRQLPADSILNVSMKMGGLRFGPVLDGNVLPLDLTKAFSTGKFNQVPFMSGWVMGDGALFGVQQPTPEQFEKQLRAQYPDKAAALLKLLPHGTKEEAGASLQQLGLISFAVLSPYRWSGYTQKPAFLYQFSHVPPDKPGFPNYGAFHTAEVPYALHTLHTWQRSWLAHDHTLEQTMSQCWINFVRTGNPNGNGVSGWTRFNQQKIPVMEFGDAIMLREGLYKELLEVLSK